MNTFNNILYPTDFSKLSLAAMPYAVSLAQAYHAKLHCLHVIDTDIVFYQYGGFIAPEMTKPVVQTDEYIRAGREHMDKFVAEHFKDVENVIAECVIGKPFIEIVHYARENNIDLIVLGTHGHSAIAGMLLGSVVEKIVRKASCPVMTIRHPEHKFEMP
ncbi:MAG: universal stress protein [Sedimentisphaerales bacterium]|nr:universal stress protein [Sedimentisphaerales bacterium]